MKTFSAIGLTIVVMVVLLSLAMGGFPQLLQATGITPKPAPRYECTAPQRIQVLIVASECTDRNSGSYNPTRGESLHDWSTRTVRDCIADAIPLVCSQVK
jgi:hypothetical protein